MRLLGVGVTNLEHDVAAQLALFERPADRTRMLNRALDDISDRFGSGAIVRGSPFSTERAGLSLQIKRGEDPKPRR